MLCSECNLPIASDEAQREIFPESRDEAPWQGFHYHDECYDVRGEERNVNE